MCIRDSADTIWEALGDMRADAAGKHDARLELAVLSSDGECVTRGRVETIDDDDDDDAGDSTTGNAERTARATTRRDSANATRKRSPCCCGAAARELWTLPDADVDAWLARHEPRAHERDVDLDPNHSHFLLVDDGTSGKFAGEMITNGCNDQPRASANVRGGLSAHQAHR